MCHWYLRHSPFLAKNPCSQAQTLSRQMACFELHFIPDRQTPPAEPPVAETTVQKHPLSFIYPITKCDTGSQIASKTGMYSVHAYEASHFSEVSCSNI